MSYEPHVTKNQNIAEIDAFTEWVGQQNVRSYLEIGSKYGASLWRVAHRMPKASRVVSVDIPSNDTSGPMLEDCIARLKKLGYDAHLIPHDSTSGVAIAMVNSLGPFDLCYIDGDHTLAGVTADWENYGPMAKVVAFHDIGWVHPPWDVIDTVDVPVLWNQIKGQYRHIEKLTGEQKNGIGILWR